ncbi:hypothetical protein [Streptosporangium sp. V21-05]|uniref:hypothetical protein n=1 Tax=Streptosporangium sp. V21-05 TaxID=3446115 RepID=UPI003F52B19B
MLRTDLTGDEQSHGPSAWPEVTPGAAQPWTVPGDGAPYDWYAQPEDDPPAPWPGSSHPAPRPEPLPHPEPSGPPRTEFPSGPPRPEFPSDPARPGFPPGPSGSGRPDLPSEPSGPRTEFPPGPSGPSWSEFSRTDPAPPAPPAWINSPTPPEPSPPAWPAPPGTPDTSGPSWPGPPAPDTTSPAWPPPLRDDTSPAWPSPGDQPSAPWPGPPGPGDPPGPAWPGASDATSPAWPAPPGTPDTSGPSWPGPPAPDTTSPAWPPPLRDDTSPAWPSPGDQPSAPWPGPPGPGDPPGPAWPGASDATSPAWPAPPGTPDTSGPSWPGSPAPDTTSPAWPPPLRDDTSPAWPTDPAAPSRPGGIGEGERHEHGGPAPRDDQPLSTAPIVPGAPPWQPPPAFTAAAAGMQVWPSSGQGAPWPAATGEPVWTTDPEESAARPGEPGDVAVWPPDAVPQQEPGESGDTTVDVRATGPATPGHPEQGDLLESDPAPQRDPLTGQAPAQASPPQATPRQVSPQQPSAPPASGPRAEPLPPGPAPATLPSSFPGPVSGPMAAPMAAPMSAPLAQPVTRPEPEPTSPVPTPPLEQAAHDRRPSQAGDPGQTAVQPFPVSDATPPGGIPVVTGVAPPFPVLPPPPATSTPAGEPTAVLGTGQATTRGAFTPLSAFTPEPPPPPPAPARSRASTTLIAAVVAVVVVGIGTGAFFAYQSFSAKQSANATDPIPSSGTLDPTDDLDITGDPEPINTTMLNSEKTDPGTMTVADAFGKKVSVAGTTFTRVKTDVTEQCQKAASGRFAGTLRTQECRRVLRATYVDSKRRYAVTTGIAVLPTRESAVAADKAKNLGSNLWFRGLPSAAGTGGERVHIAGGYAAGMVWGRYIVFSYATFSDGHTPTAKEKGLGKVSGAFRDQTAKVVERRVTS